MSSAAGETGLNMPKQKQRKRNKKITDNGSAAALFPKPADQPGCDRHAFLLLLLSSFPFLVDVSTSILYSQLKVLR